MKIKLRLSLKKPAPHSVTMVVEDERILDKEDFMRELLLFLSKKARPSLIGVESIGNFIKTEEDVYVNVDDISIVHILEGE